MCCTSVCSQLNGTMADSEEMFGDDEDEVIPRDPDCGVLAFHTGTEDALWAYVQQHTSSIRGDVNGILRAIDEFCYSRHWMMHVGDQKRGVVEDALETARSNFYSTSNSDTNFTAVELGSYCGYSALLIAQHLDASRNERLFCLEVDLNCVRYTTRLVNWANLGDRVTVLHVAAGDVSSWRQQLLPRDSIQFLFLDHEKLAYHSDLVAVESAGLLKSQSVVVADNVLCLQRPLTSYLEYVRNHQSGPFISSCLHETYLEYTTDEERQSRHADLVDGLEVSIHR